MANPIVIVNVSQLVAPTPSTLQKTGALISQGATTVTPGTASLLTQLSDLSAILQSSLAVASLTWSGGIVTVTLENTTIVSGTYNSGTGLVTLTLTATINVTPGMLVNVSGATGTGAFAQIDGTFTAAVGSSGTTLEYTIATGLTMTITGGNVSQTTGQANGATFVTTIAGDSQSGYNGTFLATVTGADTFTYPLASNPGSSGGSPTYTAYGVGELTAMATTFFAQGNTTSVYVLELGPGTPAQGVTALGAYIAQPQILPSGQPLVFYAFLQPVLWATESTAPTLAKNHSSLTSKVYFFQTVTLSNFTPWIASPPAKSIVLGVQAAAAPLTEFSLAQMLYRILSQSPSSATKLQPTAFAFAFGCTPFGPTNTQAATLKANNINYIDVGAEGGISNAILKYGRTSDGFDFSFWYAADWVQINIQLILANAVINGANDPLNPLLYNQQGINTLQSVAQGVINNGISFGVINNATPVAAVGFTTYTTQNPGDYKIGKYAGLSVTVVPQVGFDEIDFNLVISSFGTA